jgi:hypothetical protein
MGIRRRGTDRLERLKQLIETVAGRYGRRERDTQRRNCARLGFSNVLLCFQARWGCLGADYSPRMTVLPPASKGETPSPRISPQALPSYRPLIYQRRDSLSSFLTACPTST